MHSVSTHPFSLEGKRILVTGASSGIGRSCAIELSKLGARIILVARNQSRLEETLSLMPGQDHRIESFDLGQGEETVRWLKHTVTGWGTLDGLVHSAGISTTLPIRATDYETFRRIITTNLESAYFLCKAFRQTGVRSHSGSIVLIGSVMGLVGQPGLSAYCATKGALIPMVKSLALEFASERIRVNLLAPGYIQTAMMEQVGLGIPEQSLNTLRSNHPLGIGCPEDVAHAATYLLSDAARWVTGTTLVVDGGYTAA